jgi:hypothetical protein
MIPMILSLLVAFWYVTRKPFKILRLPQLKKTYVQALVGVCLMTYTPVVAPALEYFSCVSIENVYLLSSQLTIQCYDSNWWNYFALAIFVLIFYMILWPVGFMLFWKNKMLGHTLQKESMTLYFLVKDFKHRMSFWMGVILLQRAILVACASLLYPFKVAQVRNFSSVSNV